MRRFSLCLVILRFSHSPLEQCTFKLKHFAHSAQSRCLIKNIEYGTLNCIENKKYCSFVSDLLIFPISLISVAHIFGLNDEMYRRLYGHINSSSLGKCFEGFIVLITANERGERKKVRKREKESYLSNGGLMLWYVCEYKDSVFHPLCYYFVLFAKQHK